MESINAEKGKAIIEHFDAICNIMGAKPLSSVAKEMESVMSKSIAALPDDVNKPALQDQLMSDITYQVGLTLGSVMSEYSNTLSATLKDETKIKEILSKTMEDMKNGK